jgi:hypothetical protein
MSVPLPDIAEVPAAATVIRPATVVLTTGAVNPADSVPVVVTPVRETIEVSYVTVNWKEMAPFPVRSPTVIGIV